MTTGQREVLNTLTSGPLTIDHVYLTLNRQPSWDAINARLRRLEDRGLARRLYTDGAIARWELTRAGRSALELTT